MIRGGEALGARLERMKERLYRGAEETVAEAAQAVCAEAAARAPVETGRLRSSIHASAEGLTAAVRCDCPYGAAVELGTSRQSARPFMQPAADTERANGSSCVGEGCAGGRKGRHLYVRERTGAAHCGFSYAAVEMWMVKRAAVLETGKEGLHGKDGLARNWGRLWEAVDF